MTNHKTLRDLAEAAKDEKWSWSGRKVDDDGYVYIPQGSYLGNTLINLGDTYEDSARDCDFIAAANPQAVLGLLDIVDAAEEAAACRVAGEDDAKAVPVIVTRAQPPALPDAPARGGDVAEAISIAKKQLENINAEPDAGTRLLLAETQMMLETLIQSAQREVTGEVEPIESTVPKDWVTASYGECPGAGERYIEMLQDVKTAAMKYNFMPGDKVRDVRDYRQRTWRIKELSAHWDRTKIALEDVKDYSNIVADYDGIRQYLILVAAANREAIISGKEG